MLTEIDLSDSTLKSVLEMVFKYTGITMNEKKRSLLQSRLRPRLRELSLKSYEEYVNYLKTTQSEVEVFIDCVTTNETFFFRTHRVWDFFNKRFLPEWYAEHKGETLKIWSAASSSGEEIYSLGICATEFQLKHPDFKFELNASDISQEILGKAQAGIYGERSVDGLKKYNVEWYHKYIETCGDKWKIKDTIRNQVRFSSHNLMTSPKLKNYFDIVFLRNVMIYFQDTEQKIILKNVSQALKQRSHLVLGESESINRLETDLKFLEPLVYTYGK